VFPPSKNVAQDYKPSETTSSTRALLDRRLVNARSPVLGFLADTLHDTTLLDKKHFRS